MPKLPILILMALLMALGVFLGQAAETSRVALALVVTIFSVFLSIPASLCVGLYMQRRRPQVTHHHYHDHRQIVIMRPAEPPAQVVEPERRLTVQ